MFKNNGHMYIAPGQGQTTPLGQLFFKNINLLSIWSFAASFALKMTKFFSHSNA